MGVNGIQLSWQEVVAQKRKDRDNALQPFVSIDQAQLEQRPIELGAPYKRTALKDESKNQITDENEIQTLLQQIQSGKFSAEQVVRAYIERVVVGHQLTNALTEISFDEAIEEAKELDAYFKQSGKIKGPLHGIPFTVKDQFNIKGHDTTLGYCGRAFKPAVDDAVLVDIIKDAGGVVIGKTNLPQTIMWCETDNPLWGLTVNPRNPNFTPGGSTGGEGALQALHSSLAGFGTDIGGSVRIPQTINGLYGLKPSNSRMPYEGVPVSTEGQEHVPSSVGPMTRSLDSLIYLTKAIVDGQPWTRDPKCAPIPWREEDYQDVQSRPLVIGVMVDDGVVKAHPPILRALREVVEVLRSAGHEIVTWNAEGHAELIEILDLYYTSDGCEDIRRDIEAGGEPMIPHVEALVNRGSAISVYEYWQLHRRRNAAQKRYLDKWNKTRSPSGKPLDILLTPAMPHVAVPHRGCKWVGYTKVWNVLDYTAMSFPVSAVSKEKDDPTTGSYEPRGPLDEWNNNLYNLETMAGHPINLQIVGRRLEEEKVLGAAKVIETVWRSQ